MVSNEIPGGDDRADAARDGRRFRGRARVAAPWLPLMEVNFVESNPIPVKAAMAMMGLLRAGVAIADDAAVGDRIAPRSKRCSKPAGCCRRRLADRGARMRTELRSKQLFDEKPAAYTEEHFALFAAFKQALNQGAVRAAEPDASTPSGWRVNAWVKKGVLLGFRMGAVVDMSIDPARQPMFDKATWPVKQFTPASGVRIVPGGSSIRDGCYIGKGVICMPPMYINAGT